MIPQVCLQPKRHDTDDRDRYWIKDHHSLCSITIEAMPVSGVPMEKSNLAAKEMAHLVAKQMEGFIKTE